MNIRKAANTAVRVAALPPIAAYTLVAHSFNKAAAVTGLPWRMPGGGFSFPWVFGQGGARDRYDYASIVGDGRGNSIVADTVAWVQRAFPEAPCVVSVRQGDDKDTPVPTHPLARLLAKPNDFYGPLVLWAATVADLIVTGNSYWLIGRGPTRAPTSLWWVPTTIIEPKWPQDGSAFISHYAYRPNGYPIPVDPDDVVHLKVGLDPSNIRKGMSALAAQLRECFTDEEAAAFTATLLRNLGMPGLILSPTDPRGLTQKQAEFLKQNLQDKFSGERRGEPFVSTGGLNVDVVGWSPEQINLRDIRAVPEERISAAIGVPAVIVGLGAGLDQSTNRATVETLKRVAWEGAIIPLHRVIGEGITQQLIPEFGDPDVLRVWFDTSKVAALQEDRSALWADISRAIVAGWMTVGQGLEHANMPHAPEDEYYLRSTMIQAVPGDGFKPREIPAVPDKGASNSDLTPADAKPTPAQLLPFQAPQPPAPVGSGTATNTAPAVPAAAAASRNGAH